MNTTRDSHPHTPTVPALLLPRALNTLPPHRPPHHEVPCPVLLSLLRSTAFRSRIRYFCTYTHGHGQLLLQE
ncbi:unnamed protein product [Periconia digitata]|uniref:Uncharacterized protein n=1 Tax=Periconia digitata TaxID=1303443 RepID=A0A9W4XMY2_9PLEO|nr:unnamed protein product [Periconia digitata]